MRGISWPAERLLPPQEGIRSRQLENEKHCEAIKFFRALGLKIPSCSSTETTLNSDVYDTAWRPIRGISAPETSILIARAY